MTLQEERIKAAQTVIDYYAHEDATGFRPAVRAQRLVLAARAVKEDKAGALLRLTIAELAMCIEEQSELAYAERDVLLVWNRYTLHPVSP